MTAIYVNYKTNATSEQYPPPERLRIAYLCPDGRPATVAEIAEIQELFAKAMIQVNANRRKRTGPVEPIWNGGGYRIDIERDDGLPLNLSEVQNYLLNDALRRFNAAEEVEVINIPKTTLAIVAQLPLLGFQAWAMAAQQLEPDSSLQVVTLAKPESAQLLVDAGLIERFDGGAEYQYRIASSVACCTVERRCVDLD